MSVHARWLVLAIAAVALAATGCGDTHLSLERERIALGKELMNTMSSAKNANEMFDKAPQVEAIAGRLERLAERRGKLKPASEAEKSQLAKLRETAKEEMKAKSAEWQANIDPKNMFSGGLPDMAKMQKFMTAMGRLAKANVAYAPDEFSGAGGAGFPQGMPSFSGDGAPSGGGLPGAGLVPFPSGGKASSP